MSQHESASVASRVASRRVRVWFGDHVIADYLAEPDLADRYAAAMTRRSGWSVFIPGVPIMADGATFDAAITDMIQALREHSEDWHGRLSGAPNHRGNRQLVQLVSRSDDAQLRDWLVGCQE